ncbi:prepilin peptidase [uncultured Algimonas sp.]|uniref:A24 family peptidase n=1 Tax=uncultured Algimonas sp. TaxID=1547920 RepID=UPI00263676E2|nr:prepilin peptidase [uncultured Algimonas sp.]
MSVFIVTLIFAVPLLVAAYTDFDAMTIPNKVSLAMFAGFFLTLPLHWQGLPQLGEHLAVFGLFFLAGFALFAFGWIGGGDAKLMAAISVWFGWGDAPSFIIYTTLFGAALGLFLLLSRNVTPVRLRTSAIGMKLFQGDGDMPYGLALAAGALCVWPGSRLFTVLLA